ncbi:ABC transporter permease [Agrobacterium tumefaciens]|jgi:peptide/nickel transport system permease protein|uniref:Riorf63 protein n=2 Tax=Rhizobium/Agrobacterium group TaxID=227290 RepID=Q9KWC1_RHIRH|nr:MULTISPECIES: ABC transporter permease [Rhizobium/Agrobacterium group]ASK42944.1 peptide ABC transporter permease [Rhizobium rhizogenes]MCZ7977350.1 ABC transporter permease [Agrobacterium salinitolerans]MDA5243159.1 ABC transporter permease [Agrobacterium sp. MAFF310724]MDA5247659.1 ABC transporter permease [Agrobacterium sp. MAFF210268]TRB03328.1 ABC transporter permease [Agrobacterium tumefaciens]
MTDIVELSATERTVVKRGTTPTRRMLQIAVGRLDFRIGLIGFGLLLGLAILLPFISSVDPLKMAYSHKFIPPFPSEGWQWPYVLGTDQLGRDVLMRCLVGLCYSLFIGVTTVILMFIVGCSLGLLAGFRGGWLDTVIMRLTDAQLSIPMIILAITILGVSRPTVPAIILVLGLSGWPLYARVARSVALGERNRGYVLGERVLGASDLRIMLLFVAPVVLPPIAFVAVLDIARMMIFESILGFLGLGVQPPTPTFGNVIADSRKYLLNAWWIATMPGLFMLISLTCLNLMGSALERARNAVLRGDA